MHLPRSVRPGPWLPAALVILLAACGEERAPAPPRVEPEPPPLVPAVPGDWSRPHVVLIMLDTLRADALGSYGCPWETSPELDQLARDGVRFRRVVAPAPWTRPSIASLLTSQVPRTLGIHHEHVGGLREEFTTLAEVLRDHGYRTLGATANPHLNRVYHFDQGFQEYQETRDTWWWQREEGDPEERAQLPMARDVFQQVLELLDQEDPEQRAAPHYLQFNVMDVHEAPAVPDVVREPFRELFPDIPEQRKRSYHQGVRQVSADVGWLKDQLLQRPGWEDVLFVVVSDHGEGLDDHPGMGGATFHGYVLYDSNVLVPWILYRTTPAQPRGLILDPPVSLLDLMPTVLELADVPVPPEVTGRSLAPWIVGDETPDGGGFQVTETRFRDTDKLAVVSGDWKLVLNRDGQPGSDPLELQRFGEPERGHETNQAERHPEIVEALRRFLEDWQQRYLWADSWHEGPLTEQQRKDLEAVGYVGGDSDG